MDALRFCNKCYYDLRGTTTNLCPECGQPFDLDDPSTFLSEKPRFSDRIVRFIGLVLVAVVAAGAIMIHLLSGMSGH